MLSTTLLLVRMPLFRWKWGSWWVGWLLDGLVGWLAGRSDGVDYIPDVVQGIYYFPQRAADDQDSPRLTLLQLAPTITLPFPNVNTTTESELS